VRLGQEVQALSRRLAASERLSPEPLGSGDQLSGGDELSGAQESRPIIHVVAAAVIDAHGRVLIAQRPVGRKLAGGWEFPGGKVEPGEARRDALARELAEEVGIAVAGPVQPLIRLRHIYEYGEVLLDVWVVRHFLGEARGLDGQALRWCTPDELARADGLLEAGKPIVRALRLPERLFELSTGDYGVVSHGSGWVSDGRILGVLCRGVGEAEGAAAAGAEFVVLAGVVTAAELAGLCERVAVPVYARGVGLVEAWALGATGVNEMGGGD
jgi:mutator protein MutT